MFTEKQFLKHEIHVLLVLYPNSKLRFSNYSSNKALIQQEHHNACPCPCQKPQHVTQCINIQRDDVIP